MLREIFSALSAQSAVDRAFSDLSEMLEHGEWMFLRANEVLHGKVVAEEVGDAIYARDRAINELERSIRRKVLRHLTINPGHDVAVCLALMSIAKDAERIGDYCKSVYEVGRYYSEGFHVPRYQQPLDRFAEQTREMFGTVAKACRESDERQARQAIARTAEIRRGCDRIIEELLRDKDQIAFHEAVAYSLLARHYKRVAAHLSNIATSVLGDLEHLDFEPPGGED
jgi:phosphate transport system protein